MGFGTFALALVLAASGATGSPAGCYRACAARVPAAHRAAVCRPCIHADPDRGAWVVRLGAVEPFPDRSINAAFGDVDWQVRWGAVRARAARQGHPAAAELARITALSRGAPRLSALFVAAHLAARERKPLAAVWAKSRWARAADEQARRRAPALRAALEVMVYGDDPVLQLEALNALAWQRQLPPARVVLDAMASRDRGTDWIAAKLLLEAARGEKGVGHQLLSVGRKSAADVALIDALLALYSKEIDALAARIEAAPPEERQQIASSLGAYAPLADRELERLLNDRSAHVRSSAANAIAAGAGQSLLTVAQDPARAPNVRARLIEGLGSCESEACALFLQATAANEAEPPSIRAAAIAALGEDAGRRLALDGFVRSADPEIRAAALLALPAQLPNRAGRCDLVAPALDDPDPRVLAAAVTMSVRSCGPRLLEEVAALHESPHEAVRAAAVTVIADHGGRPEARVLAARLREDSNPDIRLEAVRGLTRIGGGEAASALAEASRRDDNSRVQHLARQSLRRMGFGR